jgi:hypothetical protein
VAIKILPLTYKIVDTDEPVVRGHVAWKNRKINKGIEQAKDRASMIPADTVWRDLGLEG